MGQMLFTFGQCFAITNEAVTSPRLWPALHMLHIVLQMHEHMSAWSESCSCHSGAFFSDERSHIAKCMERLGMSSCRLASRRSCDLACGEFDRMTDEIQDFARAEVVLAVQPIAR